MREWREEDEEEEEEITGRTGERACETLLLSQCLTINFYLEVLKSTYQKSKTVNSVWLCFLRWILEHVTPCVPQESVRIIHGGGQMHLA